MKREILKELQNRKIIHALKCSENEYKNNPDLQSHVVYENNVRQYYIFIERTPDEIDILLKCKIAKELFILRTIAIFFTVLAGIGILYYLILLLSL